MYDLANMNEIEINELIERLHREDQQDVIDTAYVRNETMIEYTEE